MSCPDCISGHVHHGDPKGTVEKLHGLDTYVSKPSEGKITKGIIVIIPDAFGMPFVNNKLLADHYSEKGDFIVYLPDFMRGQSYTSFVVAIAHYIYRALSPRLVSRHDEDVIYVRVLGERIGEAVC